MTEPAWSRSAGDLGRALDRWGLFSGPDGRTRAPGEWIPSDGELVRGAADRTQLDLITVDAPHMVVERTPAHVARTRDIRHVVVVQLAGTSVLTPLDGTGAVRFEPGTVSYGDAFVGYRWEFEGPFQLMLLRAPPAALPIAPAALQPMLGRAFDADHGYPRLAVGFAREVLEARDLPVGASSHRIVNDVAGLFGTMLVGRLEEADPGDAAQHAFQWVVSMIDRELATPLTLPRIAEACGMSPRYVQSLFQRRGMSVSGWIRERRLESARLALADPAWATADLTQVAVAHGFADHSHFTRSFRARFGETPSRWRERVVADGAALSDPESA